ncbi:MFS transporter [Actinoallomurus sp. NPDC052308]|uniref:MFS transporter n=1 Tax=Actinoallomurus sp. NPDC052308 TaxID=3155530 RepID=UPI0034386C05
MRRGLLPALLTGQLMVSMDGSIVTVAMPRIQADLGTSGAVLQLVTGGYTLAVAVLVVTGARLGDLYGHRRLFLIGLGAFAIASLGCGLASDGLVLVLARVAQGIAAALLLPQVLSLIQLHAGGRARARALGAYSMVLALGVAVGQILGGLITGAAGWRPIFLINVPVAAAVLLVGRRALPADVSSDGRRMDLGGVAILSAAMSGLVLPLVFGREEGWPVWSWCCLALGCAGLVVFGAYERRAAHPLLDLGVVRLRGVRPGLLACCCVMGGYTALFFCLALHLQAGLGLSPPRAGLAFLPYPVGFAAASLSWPRLPARRVLPVAGPLCLAAAAPVIALVARHGWPLGVVTPLLVLAGAGHAAGFGPLVERLAAMAGPARASAISALTNTGTLLTSVVAIATLGGVYLAAPRSADGLVRVTALLGILLPIGAACAWRTARVATGSAEPARPVPAEAVTAGDGPARG